MTVVGVIVALVTVTFAFAFTFAVANRRRITASTDLPNVRLPDNSVRISDSTKSLVRGYPMRPAALPAWTMSAREIDRALAWWLEDPVDDRAERDPVSAVEQARMKLHSRLRELTTTVEPRTKST